VEDPHRKPLFKESEKMQVQNMKFVIRTFGIALLTFVCWSVVSSAQTPFVAGTWTKVAKAPPAGVGHIQLLTDGSVLALNSGCSATGIWYRLVPSSTGSYVNGTWHAVGAFPAGYNPLYFASAVLPNGNFIVMGGEYNACHSVWTTLGALYTASSNTWTPLTAPIGWTTVGDAQSVVLPNGKFMLANCCTTDEALLTLSGTTATWTATGTGKADSNDEEGWTLLPNGKVLTVDANNGASPSTSEIYTPSTGAWTAGPTLGVQLQEPSSHELGPAVLRPDGTVFYAGATPHNAIYHASTNTWTTAPSFGGSLDIADGPGSLLPDGNVLLDTSPGVFNTGTKFFEWSGTALQAVPGPPNAAVDSSYYGNMVVLPTGQILFTDNSSDVEVYTPVGSPCSGCAPAITSVASSLTHGTHNNVISGTQFSGRSQGAAYGDDSQNATNFPLVRITDATGKVVYCRTHNFNSGVSTGARVVSAQFDIPSSIALGAVSFQVVTNGIASAAVAVTII
jgi:hypothetical protein